MKFYHKPTNELVIVHALELDNLFPHVIVNIGQLPFDLREVVLAFRPTHSSARFIAFALHTKVPPLQRNTFRLLNASLVCIREC